MARVKAKHAAHPLWAKVLEQGKGSGLSEAEVIALGWTPLSAEEVGAVLGSSQPRAGGMKLPYFDLEGKQTDFFRIRYLEKLPGLAGIVEKPQRYAQPAGTLNEVYYPPLLAESWKEIADDASKQILVTEGCKKAASACHVGLACLGLGGVDVWRAAKRGIDLLPSLCEIKWSGRDVVIVFDSDAAENPNVVRAQLQLAHELVARGAKPAVASLPPADGGKQGLDDFIVAHGRGELDALLAAAVPHGEGLALWEMNEEVVYVKDPGIVLVREDGRKLDPGRFVAHAYANQHYVEEAAKFDKEGRSVPPLRKKKPLAPHWIEWEHRSEVEKIVYEPGQPKLTEGCWNDWRGWGVEPEKGDISPWTTTLDHIFKGKPDDRKWFEQWCAYPIQHPGVKLFTYVMLWSVETGTGKSFLSYALKAIYGRNGVEIGNEELSDSFTGWGLNRQFVIGDEITAAGDARMDADKLKRMICRPQIKINQKFIPEYWVTDCINYWFNSNHPDGMFLEDRDRRAFIHRVPDTRLPEDFWIRADKWLNTTPRKHDGPGPRHLMHHLLNVDLTGFNPSAPAPMTAAKEEMIINGKSDIGMWVVQLREDPCRILRPLGEKLSKECDLFTAAQLLLCYDSDKSKKVTPPGLGRELAKAGIRQVNGGSPVRTKKGVIRLYAARNGEEWAMASPKKVADHYEAFFENQKF